MTLFRDCLLNFIIGWSFAYTFGEWGLIPLALQIYVWLEKSHV